MKKNMKNLIRPLLPISVIKFFRNKKKQKKNIRILFQKDQIRFSCQGENLDGILPVLYWDKTPNFGDMIGPYLISKITGKPVLNILDLSVSGYMTVGSILQVVDRKGLVVWGSGLIEVPTEEVVRSIKKYEPKVLSVRGKETARHLENIGIKVENAGAFGDPALIMPLFYTPKSQRNINDIAVCPHYIHKPKFCKYFDNDESIKLIDVQMDLESVIDDITSTGVCISTSLHGLIMSQAYGIPWVWLEVVDANLKGDDFKFNDFFSTLNQSQVAHVRVSLEELAALDLKKVAAKASLPDKYYKEELIFAALKKQLISSNHI